MERHKVQTMYFFSDWKMKGESCMAADTLVDTEWWCQRNWA